MGSYIFLKNFKATRPSRGKDVEYNFAYYPVLFDSAELLKKVLDALNHNWIYPRRYFYPSLEELPYVGAQSPCKVASDIASRALCLPLYDTLSKEEIDMICRIMLRAQNN